MPTSRARDSSSTRSRAAREVESCSLPSDLRARVLAVAPGTFRGCDLDCRDVTSGNAGHGIAQDIYPSVSALSSDLKKLVACFSGQCPNAASGSPNWFWTCDENSGASLGCSDACLFSSDNHCDDGGPGSEWSLCSEGTDCHDCGARSGLQACQTSTWGTGGLTWSAPFSGQPFTVPPHATPNTGTYVAGIGGWAHGSSPCTGTDAPASANVSWHVWGGHKGSDGLTLFSGAAALAELAQCTDLGRTAASSERVFQIRYRLSSPPAGPPPTPPPGRAPTTELLCPEPIADWLATYYGPRDASIGCHTSPAEIEHIPPGTATLSSTLGHLAAGFCTDGDTVGDAWSICMTETESDPWLQLDLGVVRFLSYYEIVNRPDCCRERLGAAELWVSSGSVGWPGASAAAAAGFSRCASFVAATGEESNEDSVTRHLKIGCGREARFVVLLLPGTGRT